MITTKAVLAVGAALAAVGLWWLLPGSGHLRRMLGGLLAVVGFGLLASQVPAVGDWFAKGLFYAIAAVTIVAALSAISFRSPVYCAIWFGMTLTGVAGLFLLAGAEFLSVATLVVYAGAILVTFLFVLMLSQPEGHTTYDRRSWEAMVSAFTGAALVGILTMMIGAWITRMEGLHARQTAQEAAADDHDEGKTASSQLHAGTVNGAQGAGAVPPTIGQLGAVLFTRYLVAVEAAGILLFVALVGAAVIVSQGRAAGTSVPGPQTSANLEGGATHAS